MGNKERYYFGYAIFIALLAAGLAILAPGSLIGFASVTGPLSAALYGGALGKLWVESNGKTNGVS
jgi:hypothetical protein